MTFAMPKRLLLLSIIYSIAAMLGLVSGKAVVPALLLLFLVLSIFARQQATGWILRGLAILALLALSLMPYLLEQNPPLAEQWQQWLNNSPLAALPNWLLFSLSGIVAMLQLWLLFTPKVGRWFQRKNNFNIMN
ncbi:hypothetical protein JYB87_05435 [Shewanella avicenniae]|uniref:Uncharacterized protein n=1 Tax=Shewanella avicenniae TaxID=2814294 RepID=A0ABX7QUT5_9GAMM|nr:hypothetical protein [Shewanella avicenniae]QSX34680.1 hypothetical protein JYB87_05435 [Shewanella avicenniae]